jgi:hypothetical protein
VLPEKQQQEARCLVNNKSNGTQPEASAALVFGFD